MLFAHVAHMAEPIISQADPGIGQRRVHAPAAVMATDDDVLDLQDVDGELQHGEAVQVRMHDHVGDIAVDKQLARRHADQFVSRDAAVRTADPQVFRRLLGSEVFEEIRILFDP